MHADLALYCLPRVLPRAALDLEEELLDSMALWPAVDAFPLGAIAQLTTNWSAMVTSGRQ